MSRAAIAVLALLLVWGCQRPEIVTALNRTFQLGVGRQAVIPDRRLEIGFERVLSDSRCPEGGTCVWAGEARVWLWLRPEGGGEAESFEARLSASTKPDSAAVVPVGDYDVRVFQLTPYPRAGQPIDTTAYRVEMRVTRR
jgi:hypothetical protein